MTFALLRAFVRVFHDLEDGDRTDGDDLDTLERAGLMRSRVLTEDDDFFGLDSLEPGDTCYEWTQAGRDLAFKIRKRRSARYGNR